MMIRKYSLSVLLLALLLTLQARAQTPLFNHDGLAIQGYDPVAYFIEKGPLMGQSSLSYRWKGVRWQFASQVNRDRFISDPEKYAPQYGGYCAYAMAQGSLASTDPAAWTVIEGKLYLNYSLGVRQLWNTDRQGFIQAGDRQWKQHQ